jgi:predicted KAP-like P-loop ATPase
MTYAVDRLWAIIVPTGPFLMGSTDKEFALAGAAAGRLPVTERDYLEKIVQVPFTLPPLAPQAIRRFLQARLPAVTGLSDDERS